MIENFILNCLVLDFVLANLKSHVMVNSSCVMDIPLYKEVSRCWVGASKGSYPVFFSIKTTLNLPSPSSERNKIFVAALMQEVNIVNRQLM